MVVSSIMLDFSVVFFLIMFWISGFRRGVLKSCSHFLGTVCSVLLISICSKYICGVIYDVFLKQIIIDFLKKIITNPNGIINSKFSKLQWFINFFLFLRGTNYNNEINLMINKEDFILKILNLISPNIINILNVFVSILIYTIVMYIIKIVTKALYRIFNFSKVSKINRFLGGVFGLCKGFCMIWIFAFFLKFSLPTLAINPDIISENTINSSILFKKIYNFKIHEVNFNKIYQSLVLKL